VKILAYEEGKTISILLKAFSMFILITMKPFLPLVCVSLNERVLDKVGIVLDFPPWDESLFKRGDEFGEKRLLQPGG
jgi:hypothetical protein